jgi:hypothetical protein
MKWVNAIAHLAFGSSKLLDTCSFSFLAFADIGILNLEVPVKLHFWQ